MDRVVVVAPRGSRLPPGAESAPIEVRPVWALDSLSGLLRAARMLIRERSEIDQVVFNIHLTSFGRRPWVNALGLLLPVWVARSARRRPIVFLHHLLESQDIAALGYRPSAPVRWWVRRLERGLLARTDVVVPLESQRRAIEAQLGGTARVVFPSLVEAVGSGLVAPDRDISESRTPEVRTAPVRVLLFGYWGPQKELEGVLADLASAVDRGSQIRVTVAGEVNRNFPSFEARLRDSARRSDADVFRFVGPVPDGEVGSLLRSHDVLLLPYRATGGYSGAMNLAAATSLAIVAYDLPQLRETAAALARAVRFVPPRDADALARAIAEATPVATDPKVAWQKAVRAAEAILQPRSATGAPAG